MNTQQAYNEWAAQYDTNENKTRDLEAIALRETLASLAFSSCLEIGCGTGKNTAWLSTHASAVTAVDFSAEMLGQAKQKITAQHVQFVQADIQQPWAWRTQLYDLVTFSLVLEHIQDLGPMLEQAAQALHTGGYVYAGELHPFKQYGGSKARYETETGTQVVECFTHHVSDFVQVAQASGLALVSLNEYFDGGDRNTMPRIIALLFQKAA